MSEIKVGDWVEWSGTRRLVYEVEQSVLHAGRRACCCVTQVGCLGRVLVDDPDVKHLPDCTGWDWQPEPKWRAATIEDAIRAIRGEKVECRVRSHDDSKWVLDDLSGYDRGDEYCWIVKGNWFKRCEVKE